MTTEAPYKSWLSESWGEHLHTAATLQSIASYQLRRGNAGASLQSQNAATDCLRDLAERMAAQGIEQFATATHEAHLRRRSDHLDAVVVRRDGSR